MMPPPPPRQYQTLDTPIAQASPLFHATGKWVYLLYVPILSIVIISMFFYFNFTAEDAYITYRYAENFVNIGALVYNVGEPINALTSPFHALLSSLLFAVTGQTVPGNKVMGVFLLLLSATLVWYRFRNYPYWQLLSLILVVLPPSVLLWTFGGLETPVLLFLVTAAGFLASDRDAFSLRRLYLLALLTGLAFITRYDSVLFFLPVMGYAAWKARDMRHIALAFVVAAVLPVGWLAISVLYYGDPLPTSFYVKTPNGNAGHIITNGRYILSYLLYIGILPVVALAFSLLRSKRRALQFLYGHFKSMGWLYAGIAFELVYGLTMATHHMMFSFRFFIPYLPSAAIVVVDLARRAAATNDVDFSARRPATVLSLFLMVLTLFQLYQIVYTYKYSVNGIVSVGEYQSLGIRDYDSFMALMQQEALDVKAHWDTIKGAQHRRPRIITYAAGMLPYVFRDSYIYEQLVSYRHCFQRHDQALYADYIHIIAPRHGSVDEQLPLPLDKYSLVSSHEMFFDGSEQQFLVYYNPQPEANNLSAGINDPCEQQSDLNVLQNLP